MENTTPTIRQWNEEIFQLLYQYYQGVSNMSNSGTFNIKGVLEYIRKILFNKKFNIPNEDAMKSSVLEGITTFKQDSYNAFKAFKDSIEMYIEIAMYSIQLLDQKEIVSNSLSIGKCNKRLLEALQERCRLNENETRKLGYFIEEGETWRNIWHHNTPPREDTDIHKKGCQIALEFLFAVSAICRRIEMARGGIRFTADITCSLDFQNGGQNRSFTYVDVNTPLQIEGKAGEYTLRITINDKDGAKTFTREGVIKSNQYNNEVLQKDSHTHKKNKIRIAPIVNLGNDALDGIPWKQGYYQGAVDSESQPHGIGTYIQEEKKFGGRFQHGEPQGVFKVSCPEFEYKGTIVANNDSPWDLHEGEMEMSDIKELKFIGRFKDFCCIEGKLLIANIISYEGTFKTINGQTTVSGYGTLYLPDHLIYRGEVFNGAPHGRGCLVDEQALEVTYTDWYMGEQIADELREQHIKGNEPVKLYDNDIFLCDITLKGICLSYSVEKLDLVIKNDGGDILLCLDSELQEATWEYDFRDTLERYTGENGKYGLKNKNGEVIVSPYYDDIFLKNFKKQTGLIEVEKDNKWGCINRYNEIVIPIIYDRIGTDCFDKTGLIEVEKDNKWGYINRYNEIVIPVIYDGIDTGCFDKTGLIEVEKDNKWGCINGNNEIVIPIIYDSIEISDFGLFEVKKDSKWGYINGNNEIVIPIIYDEFGFESFNKTSLVRVCKDSKFGCINRNNEIVIPIIYDNISLYAFDKTGLIEVEKDNKWGCINGNNEIVIPMIYDDTFTGYFDETGLIYVEKNCKWGCINGNNKIIIPIIYDDISLDAFDKTGLIYVKKNSKWGCINGNNEIVFPIIYDDVDIFNAKKFRTAIVAALNDTCCIFDINGNYIMTPFIGRCKPFENRGNCRFLRIEKKNKDGIVCQGCFDLTQRKFIMNVIYKEITYLSADKYFKVKLNGKYEFINEEGIL